MGIASQGLVTRSTKASSTVTVSGEVHSEVGASVEGSLVEFVSPEIHDFKKVSIEDGTFEANLEAEATYHVTFWHETEFGDYKTEFDDVPLHYDLEQDLRIGDENVDLGSYEIPEGHEVQVRFEDMNGNHVEGLHIGFRTSEGSGTGPQNFFTNSEGHVYSDNENNIGLELAGNIVIEVQSPTDHTDSITPHRLSVTEDQEATVQLQNPEEWGGTIIEAESGDTTTSDADETESDTGQDTVTSDTDETESDTDQATATETQEDEPIESEERRGFFTNDPDSSIAFLDDPVMITWGGILVSIVGITMQLIGGDS